MRRFDSVLDLKPLVARLTWALKARCGYACGL